MCRQIYTHPYVCTHIVLIKWVLNLPQQSWVCRAAGLETASLVPLQRGATDAALRRHTQPPGDLEPCASAVSLALSCAAQAGLKSSFLPGSRAPCLQALPGGWAHHPSMSHLHWSAWPAPWQQRDCCTYTGGVRTQSLHCQSIWAVAGQTPNVETFGRGWSKEGFHILHNKIQI